MESWTINTLSLLLLLVVPKEVDGNCFTSPLICNPSATNYAVAD